jgi:NAD(P)H-hydrate epimerase
MARQLLPRRTSDGHKGTFGWVLLAAGSHRYWGAAALAGKAAYRAGAGLVAIAVPSLIRSALASQLPEATYPLVAEEEVLGAQAAQLLVTEMKAFKALLVGPGLYEAHDFLETILAPANVSSLPPLVIDADGLNILAQWSDWPDRLPANTILTPHPGEMARLMKCPLAEVQGSDRVELARERATQWNCIVLLKGAYTVVAAPDGNCILLPFADPVLATAGSGDVLAGIIVALLGQGLTPYEATVLGGYLHAAAGQSAGIDAGLLAGEIADAVPLVRQQLLK